uniref:Pulmonary surfactant-associated protein A1-like n=1 Tax=Ciona intestinalis TaxID=7719 RepID=F6PTN3_CIOIN|nr:pulmonary surfactant-associated protein A1-like isoform X2 [Ciona intestinalis]|eukprot:XP_002128443.1 pulmonary surfactant-associated protein A1-like isoform X2 [Ciona intestinalis]
MRTTVCVFLFLCYLQYVQSSTTYTVCKTVESLFEIQSSRNHSSSVGKPGKRGPRGPPGPIGPVGPQGEPGQINQEVLNAAIDSRLRAIQDQIACWDGLVHNGYCYRLLFRSGSGVNFATALHLCRYHGGTLAEVDSEQTYRAFFAYVKRIWTSIQPYVQVWLGMTSQRGVAYMSNGTRAPFTEWYRTYPRSGSTSLQMAFEVPIMHSRSDKGMFDIDVTHAAPKPLCRFNL